MHNYAIHLSQFLLKGVGGVADYAHLLVGLISRRRPQNGYPAQLD
jgi:hypothetical protein